MSDPIDENERNARWWQQMHEHVTYDVAVDIGVGAVTFLIAERWRVRADGTLRPDDPSWLWDRWSKRQRRRLRMARKKRRGWV